MPNGEKKSGLSKEIVYIPLLFIPGNSNQGSTFKMLLAYERVIHKTPLLSKVRSVGPLLSPVGYSVIFLDSISRLPILFPIISVNHRAFLSGEKASPIIPELFVGIDNSSILLLFISNFPRELVLASVNQITLLVLSNSN